MKYWWLGVLLLGCDAAGDEEGVDGAVGRDGAADGAEPNAADAADAFGEADLGPVCNLAGGCDDGLVCTTLGHCAEPHPSAVTRMTLRRGDGVIFVHGEIADGERDAETLHVALGGEESQWPLSLTVAPTVPVDRLWLTPARAAEAQVWVVDRSGLESERAVVAVEEIPSVPIGSACDFNGLQTRCAVGALCLARGDEARCFAAAAHAWPFNGNMLLDITSDAEPDRTAGTFTVDGALTSPWFDFSRPSWRHTSYVGVIEGPFEVRHGGHLFARDVRMEAPPVRREGAACDGERLADVCIEGTACLGARAEEACQPVEAPVLEGVAVFWAEGLLGFEATGRDPDRDLTGFTLDVDGQAITGTFTADQDGRTSGFVEPAGDRFRAAWSAPFAGPLPTLVRVTLVDAEGLRSEIRDARVGPALPQGAGDEQLCDTSGLLLTCAEGRTCTASDLDPEPRCRVPEATCPDATALIDRVSGSLAIDLPDLTAVSCGNGWGEVLHTFLPPQTGRYRFTLEAEGNVNLALRASCTQHAELGCIASYRETVLEVDLEAGAPITVVVEAAICRCNHGSYAVTVEPID